MKKKRIKCRTEHFNCFYHNILEKTHYLKIILKVVIFLQNRLVIVIALEEGCLCWLYGIYISLFLPICSGRSLLWKRVAFVDYMVYIYLYFSLKIMLQLDRGVFRFLIFNKKNRCKLIFAWYSLFLIYLFFFFVSGFCFCFFL